MKKLLLSLSLCLVCHYTVAETCPSIHDIKTHLTKNWTAYDSDSGKPLTPTRLTKFQHSVEKFLLAEWVHQKQSVVHCYYGDHTGSVFEAYLAKKNLAPQNSQDYWYQVSGYLDCAAGAKQCSFKQLAEK